MIAADYPNAVIYARLAQLNADCEKLSEGDEAYPLVGPSDLSYYRSHYKTDIERVRKERLDKALSSGLALKAERVRRLQEHADELELIKWKPDANGRLWNERAWRQTVEDIAIEMGERRPNKDESQSDEVIKILIGIDVDRV